MAKTFKCKGRVWLWAGNAAWNFVNVDKKTSETIRDKHVKVKRGFGSVKVKATVGKTSWETSIFPDKRSGTYLLPLKKSVRYEEGIEAGEDITFSVTV